MGKKLKTNINIEDRWENGILHHPKSKELYELISKIDYVFQHDSLGLSAGGDGDNGESLLYALDVIHDAQDNGEINEIKKLIKFRGKT